ncbi:hypothetical protein C8R47DRAFT_1226614 [Mycena vitilis]|nr:hypothetical protein C8R47DRAFT_1226614 [Mycena vitilis]
MFRSPDEQLEDPVEIATFSGTRRSSPKCYITRSKSQCEAELMQYGWRYPSDRIFGDRLATVCWLNNTELVLPWLSQANQIFRDANIRSGFEDCGVIHCVYFEVEIAMPTRDPPKGFLFLSLAKHFQVGPSSFKWPDCPAYWSLDPSGVERLSTEDATKLGFPSIELLTRVWVRSWDASIYRGLRQFHQAKGFDPDSQDVARHLGHPLYQLVNKTDAPFAHVEDSDPVPTEEEFEGTKLTLRYPNSTYSNLFRVLEILPHRSVVVEEAEPSHQYEETMPTSETFRLFINARLALILFLAVLKVYETVHA